MYCYMEDRRKRWRGEEKEKWKMVEYEEMNEKGKNMGKNSKGERKNGGNGRILLHGGREEKKEKWEMWNIKK